MDEDDVFGKIPLPAKISGLQMILQQFVHADVFNVNTNVVCELYLHVCL